MVIKLLTVKIFTRLLKRNICSCTSPMKIATNATFSGKIFELSAFLFSFVS